MAQASKLLFVVGRSGVAGRVNLFTKSHNDHFVLVWRLGLDPAAALCGPPVPSCVVGCGALAKASASQHLERWAMREAGFTEQRIPPASNGGRITGRCTTGPR
jgi:hypothetical protein